MSDSPAVSRPRPRRSALAFLALALSLVASPAGAAAGIFLSWNDCPLAPASSSDLLQACDSNLGQSELFCSFSLAQPVDSVLAVEITIDLQHSEATLPAWWHFDQSPCRSGALTANGNFFGLNACEDMWHGEPLSGGIAQFTVGLPRGMANQARIKLTLAVTPDRMQTLGSTATYYAARLVLDHRNTTGAASCAGCSTPMCLVLNSIVIGRPPRPPGAPDANVLLDTPGAGHPNWATWQSGTGANCSAVPVRATTWGQIKALYR